MMKYLLFCLLLVVTLGMCLGVDTCPLGEIFYTYSIPEDWNVVGMGCCGLVASDSTNPARGIIALNHLPANLLPAYTTPESYLEGYMPQYFSQQGNQVTNMKILFYESDQSLANVVAWYIGFMASGKSMRCSFEVNGIPSQGSFTVVTNELYGYGTTVPFLAGVFAPADQFDEEAPMLVDIWKSIKVMRQFRNICTPPIGGCYQCNDDDCCGHPCNENGNCD